jgi:hypothetical protein
MFSPAINPCALLVGELVAVVAILAQKIVLTNGLILA